MKKLNKVAASILSATLMTSCLTAITASAAINAVPTYDVKADRMYTGIDLVRGYGAALTNCAVVSGYLELYSGSHLNATGTATLMTTLWQPATYSAGHGRFTLRGSNGNTFNVNY